MEVPGERSQSSTERPWRRSLSGIEVFEESSSGEMDVPGRKSHSNASEDDVPSCDPCQALHDHVDACSFCIDCNEYLCLRCTKRHTISKLSRSHKILNQNEMPKKRLSSVNINLCQKHDDTFKYYCRIHRDFCCTACVTDGHAKCGVELIKNVASDFENSQEYKSLRADLARILGEFRQIQQSLVDSDSALKNSYDQVLVDVQNFRSEMNKRLDLLENETIHRVNEIKYLIETERASLYVDCKRILAELDKFIFCLDEQEIYSQNELLFISALSAEKSLQTYETKVGMISQKVGKTVKERYHFRKNEELDEIVKSIDSLGNTETCGDTTSAQGTVRAVKNEGQINVKSSEDKDNCWITGCVDLGEDFVAIADHNNSCIKILDMQTSEIVDRVTLPIKPWDITRARDRHVIVSSDDKIVLMKLLWSPAIVMGSTVSVSGACSGVMQELDYTVASVVDPAPLVLIMTPDCQVQHTIPKEKTQHMFTSPFYITTGAKKRDIFVADYDQDRVTCIDVNGRIKATYEDTSLKGPYGLARAGDGDIFVAGSKSSNIHKITESCNQIQICLDEEDGIESPQAIEFCQDSKKLILSHNQFASLSLRNALSVYSFPE